MDRGFFKQVEFRSPGRAPFEHEATFHVDGLSCRGCARHAEQALRGLPGIRAASVGFFGEIAQVVHDVRITSEREIVAAMAKRGFALSAASGAPPSERSGLDGGRLGVALALTLNLGALGWWSPPGPQGDRAWVELGLTLLLFAVAGPKLAERALALSRRKIIGGELVSLACATLALGIGIAAMALDPAHSGSVPAPLAKLGLEFNQASRGAFIAAGAILGASLLALYAHAALLARAFRGLSRAAEARETRVRRLGPDGTDERVPCAALSPGDRVRLMEGDVSPVSMALESAARITRPDGEAEERAAGAIVEPGARLLSAEVTGRVTRAARGEIDAALDAEAYRAALRIEREARTRGGRGFVHVASLSLSVGVVAFAGFALMVHAMLGAGPLDPAAALTAIAVLVGASPAAYVLGLPAAQTIAVLRARAAGVLVKDAAALEALAKVTIACFAKAGAVTEGTPRVTRVSLRRGADASILEDVAALESGVTHPTGRAIARHLEATGVRPGLLDEARDVRPDGVVGRARGAIVEVSAARRGDPAPEGARFGASVVCARRSGQVEAWFELWDPPRAGAKEAIRALFDRGLGVRLVSGDGVEATLAAGQKLGVPALSGLSPAEKALCIRDLEHRAGRVLFVSDGRDERAPGSSSTSQGGGTFGVDEPRGDAGEVRVAIAPGALPTSLSAEIVLGHDRLEVLPWLVDLSRALRARTRECLVLSIGYNAIVVPLCAAGVLSPLGAAVLALLEALFVCGNAARLLGAPGPFGEPGDADATGVRTEPSAPLVP